MTIEVIIFSIAVIVLVSYFFWFVFDYHDKNLKNQSEDEPELTELEISVIKKIYEALAPHIVYPLNEEIDDFDLFEQFLNEKGIFELYFSRIDNPEVGNGGSSFFISCAFARDKQPEGKDYWIKIDNEWHFYRDTRNPDPLFKKLGLLK